MLYEQREKSSQSLSSLPIAFPTGFTTNSKNNDNKKKSNEKSKKKISKFEIGGPIGMTHVSHIGLDNNNFFVSTNIHLYLL